MSSSIEAQFDNAMMDIYRKALKEAKYDAKRYLQMLLEHRGTETARRLLHSSHVSEGYTALFERKRLDLTVEALILQPEWNELFDDAEREIARKRLKEYGYSVKDSVTTQSTNNTISILNTLGGTAVP